MFLALRAAPGVDAAGFEREFGAPPRAFYGPTLGALREEGLIREGPRGDFWLTARGRLLSDSVFARFV